MSVTEMILQDPRVANVVATGTVASGMGTYLSLIPDEIGKLATLVGLLLTLILSYSHWIIIKKNRLELRIAERKEEERLAEMEDRKKHGLPLQRAGDNQPTE